MLATIAETAVAIPITWASVVGLFIPILTAVFIRYRASTKLPQALFAFGASAAVATLQMLLDDIPNDTVASLLAGFLGVFIPAVASYLGLWQQLKVNEKIAPNTGL